MVDLVTLQLPEGRMGVSLLSQEISNMTRANSLEWHQGRFKLDLRKDFFPTEGLSSLERAAVESPTLEGFKRRLGGAPGDKG